MSKVSKGVKRKADLDATGAEKKRRTEPEKPKASAALIQDALRFSAKGKGVLLIVWSFGGPVDWLHWRTLNKTWHVASKQGGVKVAALLPATLEQMESLRVYQANHQKKTWTPFLYHNCPKCGLTSGEPCPPCAWYEFRKARAIIGQSDCVYVLKKTVKRIAEERELDSKPGS